MKQNNMLAMILAGGRGSRLHDLTNKVAKPAVSYGGKYRIIDFPLSNCANSGIDVVGVLTQYESVLLNSYVAAGGRWGLDAKDSGVFVLPPREKADANLDVYRGTADAISQDPCPESAFRYPPALPPPEERPSLHGSGHLRPNVPEAPFPRGSSRRPESVPGPLSVYEHHIPFQSA